MAFVTSALLFRSKPTAQVWQRTIQMTSSKFLLSQEFFSKPLIEACFSLSYNVASVSRSLQVSCPNTVAGSSLRPTTIKSRMMGMASAIASLMREGRCSVCRYSMSFLISANRPRFERSTVMHLYAKRSSIFSRPMVLLPSPILITVPSAPFTSLVFRKFRTTFDPDGDNWRSTSLANSRTPA